MGVQEWKREGSRFLSRQTQPAAAVSAGRKISTGLTVPLT